MIKNKIEMWKKLNQYFIMEIEKIEKNKGNEILIFIKDPAQSDNRAQTGVFYNPFSYTFNKIMILYERLCITNNSTSKTINLDNVLLSETIIILLMTVVEEFLTSTFKIISNQKTLLDIDEVKLIKFINKMRIKDKYLKVTLKKSHLEIALSEILPNIPSFQQGHRVRLAFSLFDIEFPVELYNKIFIGEKCYMKLRHHIVHTGNKNPFKSYLLNINFIEKAILNIAKFIYLVIEDVNKSGVH